MKTSPSLSVLTDRIFWRLVVLFVVMPVLLILWWVAILLAIDGALRSGPRNPAPVGPPWRRHDERPGGVPRAEYATVANLAQNPGPGGAP